MSQCGIRHLIEAFLFMIKKTKMFSVTAFSYDIRFRQRDRPQMRIALLLDNVAALANVAIFVCGAFRGIDNCSVVVTVSARVYMSFIADDVSNDCCEVHYGSEECLDNEFGGVEYEDVAEREQNQDVSGSGSSSSSSSSSSGSSRGSSGSSGGSSGSSGSSSSGSSGSSSSSGSSDSSGSSSSSGGSDSSGCSSSASRSIPVAMSTSPEWAEDYNEDDYWHFDDANVIMTYDWPYSPNAKVRRVH